MPRYKHIDTQPKLLPVDLARQLLPGTFEHAVQHLIDHELDLSAFEARFHNDATGAPAYPPGLLLKVVLVAYAHGVISSRGITGSSASVRSTSSSSQCAAIRPRTSRTSPRLRRS